MATTLATRTSGRETTAPSDVAVVRVFRLVDALKSEGHVVPHQGDVPALDDAVDHEARGFPQEVRMRSSNQG